MTAFLMHLAVVGKVAESTRNQTLAALLFLYRVVLAEDFGWLVDVMRANRPPRRWLERAEIETQFPFA